MAPTADDIPLTDIDLVMVAVDGSRNSALAAEHAASVAAKVGANLLGVYLIDEKKEAEYSSLLAIGEEALEEVKQIGTKFGVQVDAMVAFDQFPYGILKVAKNRGADIIAIGTHGQTGYRKVAFGSVADYLLRNSTVPLLVQTSKEGIVPHRPEEQPAKGVRIIAPMEVGEVTTQQLQMVASLGRLEGSSIVLVAVAPERLMLPEEEMELLAAALGRRTGKRPDIRLMVGSPPGTELLKAELVERADLVVMGTHRRGALGKVVLGSVSAHVVSNSAVPVLVVPPKDS